jgi:hypothetical protein
MTEALQPEDYEPLLDICNKDAVSLTQQMELQRRIFNAFVENILFKPGAVSAALKLQ